MPIFVTIKAATIEIYKRLPGKQFDTPYTNI